MENDGAPIMKNSNKVREAAVFCAGLATLLLAGCNVGPRYHAASAPAPPASYKESPANFKETTAATTETTKDAGTWTVAQPEDAKLRGKWWEIYGSPELNDLEEQLNINNQNIREFFENFMEARALVREARSQYFPTVSAGLGYTRTQSSSSLTNASTAAGTGTVTTSTGAQSQLFSLSGDVSWEPDLWGKVRNTVHAEQYNAQLSAADLENERLTEQASLAEYYFEIRGQDALQKILDDTVAADKKSYDVTKGAYETGVGDEISVVEAETTLKSAQSSALNLGVARAQYEHAIAVLIGKAPADFSLAVKPETSAPPPIPLGLPSQLLERRPDVAAAERSMAAANAQVDVAYAAYYPVLDLSADGGLESSTIGRLFHGPSRFWSVGPSLSETIYDGGLRRATVNQYVATYNANVAAYRQTVLTAFQQVEDSLAGVRILSQQVQRQQEAVAAAQKFLDLEMGRYQNGIDPYIDVMTAQTTLLSNQQSLASLKIVEMTDSVALIESLGGGWNRSQLPTPAQVTAPPSHAETRMDH
jgi:NodT family efflux transporter outer membrane factor (OMF) lipoprotein